jgi:hypothetical protein
MRFSRTNYDKVNRNRRILPRTSNISGAGPEEIIGGPHGPLDKNTIA